MKVYFLDTSALVKRYHRERGSEVIDALFAEQDRRIIISDLSIIESYKMRRVACAWPGKVGMGRMEYRSYCPA